LKERFPEAEVLPWDERFTTKIANQSLLEADISRGERKKHVDKVAAALLLQSYLDSSQGTGTLAVPSFIPASSWGKGKKARGGNKNRGYI
jgi:hypothetical protein